MTKASGSALVLFAAALGAFQFFVTPAAAYYIVDPTLLSAGGIVSPLPNGDSGPGATHPYDATQTFSFSNLAGSLRARVLDYYDAPSSAHPGLYFDYEISLTTGSLSAITISGWSAFEAYVKECGISNCGGSGANGWLATSASRSANGDEITFDFGNPLTAAHHSANLQIFSSASLFQDPLAYLIATNGNKFSLNVVGPAVPEPPTWTMMAFGLIVIGFMAYRRRRGAILAA